MDRVRAAPGIISVSTTSYLPLETTYLSGQIDVTGRGHSESRAAMTVQIVDVGPAYFATAGTPVLRGREFGDQDGPRAQRVAVVNEAMARKYWPGEEAVGQTLGVMSGDERVPYLVVGVVRTGKYRTLGERPQPVLFRALAQNYQARQVVLLHSSVSPAAALVIVRDVVARIDPNLALIQANALSDQMTIALFPARVSGILLVIIGIIGLMLALAGLAALVAYSVAHRTREIGIRLALGAQRGDVLAQFIGEGARLLAVGVVIGGAGALALGTLLSHVLFGIGAADPLTFVSVTFVLVTCALLTCWMAARRVTTIDPLLAIRHE